MTYKEDAEDVFSLESMGGILKGFLTKAFNAACDAEDGTIRSEMFSRLFNRLSWKAGLDMSLLVQPSGVKRQKLNNSSATTSWVKIVSSNRLQHKGLEYWAAGNRCKDSFLSNHAQRMLW